MYKLGRSVDNTISLSAYIFLVSTTLKTFIKLVLTFTKNVWEPWLNNENFKEKERKSF